MTYAAHLRAERFAERKRVNDQPYPDNPRGLPYSNDGRLLTPDEYRVRLASQYR